jgi:hypothetical protein
MWLPQTDRHIILYRRRCNLVRGYQSWSFQTSNSKLHTLHTVTSFTQSTVSLAPIGSLPHAKDFGQYVQQTSTTFLKMTQSLVFIMDRQCIFWGINQLLNAVHINFILHLLSHTKKCTELIYYLKSVLTIHIKTLYSFVTPTCFDTLCVIIREHTFFLAKITN